MIRTAAATLATMLALVPASGMAGQSDARPAPVQAGQHRTIYFVRTPEAPLLQSFHGWPIALLSRGLAIHPTGQEGMFVSTTLEVFCSPDCLEATALDSLRNPQRVTQPCRMTDGPVFATWGSSLSQGLPIGSLLPGATVTCLDVSRENAEIRLEGWIHSDSLTLDPADVVIPTNCKYVRILGGDQTTQFIGAIRNPYPEIPLAEYTCTYRLIVFDHSGEHLCTETFCVGSCSRVLEEYTWLEFDVTVPYPVTAFSTYRILRGKGSGIVCLFR